MDLLPDTDVESAFPGEHSRAPLKRDNDIADGGADALSRENIPGPR